MILCPALRTNRAAAQQTNIALELGKIATAQNDRFEAEQEEKEDKASSTA